MNVQPDVAIVGAGPIGLATARVAAEAGVGVLVLEKKPEGGAPSCCTGLVSPRTLSTLGVTSKSALQEIRALRIHLPGGRQINLRSNHLKAITVNRSQLEHELLNTARDAGADVHFDSEVGGANKANLVVRSAHREFTLHPGIIIGADGPHSRIASWFGLKQPARFVSAMQVEIETIARPPDRVNVFVGHDIAPGFFGWSVPAEHGILRVGLGVLPPYTPEAFLHRLLNKHYPAARFRSRSAGWIPLEPVPVPATEQVLLVGDAAGQTKPLSGGGLYSGGLCARIAGEESARAARSADRTDLPAAYAARCIEAVGREQAFGSSLRTHIARLSDSDVETIASILDDPQLLQFLADEADIDFFHQLPDRLASEPRLWSTLLRMVPLLASFTV